MRDVGNPAQSLAHACSVLAVPFNTDMHSWSLPGRTPSPLIWEWPGRGENHQTFDVRICKPVENSYES